VLATDFRAIFGDDERAFTDSTAAARVNGWLDGCGGLADVETDLPRLGLSEQAAEHLRSHAARR
jgi:hypothetical protein